MLKSLFFFFWMFHGAFPADGQCISGNCNTGYGVALFPEKGKARYNGQFLNQKPHGFGRAEYGDGSFYEGNWLNGKMAWTRYNDARKRHTTHWHLAR